MPRPPCCRRVANSPVATLFKPAGVPARFLDEIVLGFDELEALRLADLEGLYQEEAAARMGISRSTFGRVVEQAHQTVARALVHGLALRIEGGAVRVVRDAVVQGEEECTTRPTCRPAGWMNRRGRGCSGRNRARHGRTGQECSKKGEAQ